MGLPIQNLRSGTANKRPLATSLASGQIAVNYNETDPGVYLRGSSDALIKVSPTYVGSTAPNASPAAGGATGNTKGETWLDTSTTPAILKIWTGSTWNACFGFGDISLSNNAISGIKTATFNSQVALSGTSGSIAVNWNNGQNQRQPEPTGTITYAFTAPAGPCHLQLLIDSDGSSTAQTINWPGSVIFLGSTWSGANNKRSVINFWFDGTNYFAIGTNQA